MDAGGSDSERMVSWRTWSVRQSDMFMSADGMCMTVVCRTSARGIVRQGNGGLRAVVCYARDSRDADVRSSTERLINEFHFIIRS